MFICNICFCNVRMYIYIFNSNVCMYIFKYIYIYIQNRSWRFMIFHQPPSFKDYQPPRLAGLGTSKGHPSLRVPSGVCGYCLPVAYVQKRQGCRDVVWFSEKVQDQSCWRNGNTIEFLFSNQDWCSIFHFLIFLKGKINYSTPLN